MVRTTCTDSHPPGAHGDLTASSFSLGISHYQGPVDEDEEDEDEDEEDEEEEEGL